MAAHQKVLLTLIITFSIFFLFPPSVAFAQNLLRNPGFENVAEGKPTDWNSSASTISYSSTSSPAHGGNFSVSVTKTASTGYGFIFQEVNIDPLKQHKFAGWALWNDSAVTYVKLRIEWYDIQSSSRLRLDEVTLAQKDQSFQFLELGPVVPPQGAVKAKVENYIYLNAANPVNPALFDDLNFEEISPSVSPTSTPPPSPTSDPIITLTPSPSKATYKINEVKDEEGSVLASVKIYVDGTYVHHYAPETLTFCDGCKCDTYVDCGFGQHTIKLERNGYDDWTEIKTVNAGGSYEVNPVMNLAGSEATPTSVQSPTSATVKSGSSLAGRSATPKETSPTFSPPNLPGEILGEEGTLSSEATGSLALSTNSPSPTPDTTSAAGWQKNIAKILLILGGTSLLIGATIALWRKRELISSVFGHQ